MRGHEHSWRRATGGDRTDIQSTQMVTLAEGDGRRLCVEGVSPSITPKWVDAERVRRVLLGFIELVRWNGLREAVFVGCVDVQSGLVSLLPGKVQKRDQAYVLSRTAREVVSTVMGYAFLWMHPGVFNPEGRLVPRVDRLVLSPDVVRRWREPKSWDDLIWLVRRIPVVSLRMGSWMDGESLHFWIRIWTLRAMRMWWRQLDDAGEHVSAQKFMTMLDPTKWVEVEDGIDAPYEKYGS